MSEIIVSFQVSDGSIFERELTNESIEYTAVESDGFDGNSDVVTITLTITPMILGFLYKVISLYYKSQKDFIIIHNGSKLQGKMTAEEAVKKMKELISYQKEVDNGNKPSG